MTAEPQASRVRIAALFTPLVIAAVVALAPRANEQLYWAGLALAALSIAMIAALAMRYLEARAPLTRAEHRPAPGAYFDALTATGRATMWTGAIAIAAAAVTGWASFAVIGVLGIGACCAAVTWTALVAGGDAPWRRATIARAILPAVAVEGDPLREEVRLTGVAIPAGMRLFAIGRATRHGATTRYVVGSDGSGADVRLDSELGPAPRGEHRAPPLALWLGDVLGLARTPVTYRGAAAFSALPRPAVIDRARRLLGDGGDDAQSHPTQRLPSEGSFRIREYAPGDDTRRIHWVRSLQANQLVVRLPDEIPRAEPAVRLILDNHLAGTGELTCRAPDELLDALVRVWLGIGNALADTGSRVRLVTAVDQRGTVAPVERPVIARSSREALRLGARVAWQHAVSPDAMLGRSGVRQIVVSCRPRPSQASALVTWVGVPEAAWTTPEAWPLPGRWGRLPFPSGVDDNRRERRWQQRRREVIRWEDRATFSQLVCWVDWSALSGGYIARPGDGRVALEAIP